MKGRFFSRVWLILAVGVLVAVMLATSITFFDHVFCRPKPTVRRGLTEAPLDGPVRALDWPIDVYAWDEPNQEEPGYYYWWYQYYYDPEITVGKGDGIAGPGGTQ
ncbi:MAG TPA: hypothetical protein VK361_02615 [Rubrobacteraceae bacterium]|nr:hypothetical protein [Rubrobacteraceae bacterium]